MPLILQYHRKYTHTRKLPSALYPLQEAMELTQRKFLRQLVMYMSSAGHAEFPHLVFIDLIDRAQQEQAPEKEENKAENADEKTCEEQKVRKGHTHTR